jgi:hypothetical protein
MSISKILSSEGLQTFKADKTTRNKILTVATINITITQDMITCNAVWKIGTIISIFSVPTQGHNPEGSNVKG